MDRGLSFPALAFAVTQAAHIRQAPESHGRRNRQEECSMRTCLAVVLAAGEGKRMRSRLPKVLHEVGRLPLISHVLKSLGRAGVEWIAVVIGPGHGAVADVVSRESAEASIHVQHERRGTAHAVLAARDALE